MITEEYAKAMTKQNEILAEFIARTKPHTERITAGNPDVIRLSEITDIVVWNISMKIGISIEHFEYLITTMGGIVFLMYELGYLRGEGKDNIFEKMVVARDVAGG